MKSTATLTLAVIGAFILACAGLEGEVDGPTTPATTSEAPAGLSGVWSTMSLPWSGELIASDDTMLLVAWGSESVSSVNSQYDAALSGDGWTGMALIEDSEMVISSFSKGTSNVGLMVIAEEGQTYAYMEDLSMVEESAIESARSGTRPTGVSGRRPGKGSKRGKRGKGGKMKNR